LFSVRTLVLFWLCACRSGGESSLDFSQQAPQLQALETRFRGAEAGDFLAPEVAAEAAALCPRLDRAHLIWEDTDRGILEVWGSGLDRVVTLATQSAEGRVHESLPHAEPEGSLRFAVACASCELVLGVLHEDRKVGCRGPGYSVTLSRGALVP
jgi:hypothetical protein